MGRPSVQAILHYTTVTIGPMYFLPLHWLLYISTIFVNKYVLSILHFTYPTIFQGWQTLVGAVVLRILTLMGKIDLSVSDINRSNITPSMPAMLFFVGMIYAGSKALAKLPIPVFMSVHSVVHILNEVGMAVINKDVKTILSKSWSLAVIGVSAVLVVTTDPQVNWDGYTYLIIHILCSAAIRLYYRTFASVIKLSLLDKLYCNYWCSVIVLAPSSYFLGDALAAKQFPFLYFYKFYVGCVISGLCGVFLNVCAIKLSAENGDKGESLKLTAQHSSAFAKILVSSLSLLVFDMTISGVNLFWVFVCLTANLVNKFDGTECKKYKDCDNELETEHSASPDGSVVTL